MDAVVLMAKLEIQEDAERQDVQVRYSDAERNDPAA